jgi:tetratricopeptide (TPR) repeat protein
MRAFPHCTATCGGTAWCHNSASVKRFLSACALGAALSASASASAAEPRWTMVRTPSLTVIGDQSAGTLREVAIQIERFRSVVAGLITGADGPLSLPTIVFVFGAQKSAQPFMPLFNGKPIALAGYFQGGSDANVLLLSLDDLQQGASVIYHEYTHLLVRNAIRSLPTWLNEGLAEYYSGYRLDANGAFATVGRPMPDHILQLRDRYMPIAELIAVDHTSPLYNEGSKRSIFYAESWALTHYLMTERPKGAAAINRYTSALAAGQAPVDAFREAFGATPAELDTELRTYVHRYTFSAFRFELAGRVAAVTPGPPRTMTSGEANAWLGDLQRRVRRESEGAARIEAAVKADPAAPFGHAALGLLRLSTQRVGEGLDALRQASEMAPDDFFIQFLYGVSLLRTDDAQSPDTARRAAAPLTRAVAINAESADAYGWLAYAQMLMDASLPDARTSIERAMRLAPGRVEFVTRWADIRILQGAYADAKAALAKIAAIATDPDAAAAAARRLERVAQYERAEAVRNAARLEAETVPVDPSADPPASADRPPAASGSSAPPAVDLPGPGGRNVRLKLRHVGPAEQRVYGMLMRVDCTPAEVRFHVRTADGTMTATAKRMEDVELTQFLDIEDFAIACGPQPAPDAVYLTWRRDEAAVPGRVGVAVSLEFVPAGYVP